MDGTILVADDDRTIRTVLAQALTRAGCKVHATGSLEMLEKWVQEGRGDLVVTDVVMPDGNGLETLPRLLARRPGLPVIVISAQNTIMTAVKAEEANAWDYLPKPFDLPDLLKRVARALERGGHGAMPASPAIDAPVTRDLPLVGRSAAMQRLYRMVAKVVNTPLPVLITGESGAGKSLVARVLHDVSERGDRRFITAAPEDLASADAAQALVARAASGTLLLDEVGDFPPEAQRRAVRMMDSLGQGGPRILATMQGDAGSLREDLYYRISGVTLTVPPLRERVDDIPLHAENILEGGPHLAPDAMALLQTYAWPGNVRQLAHLLRQLSVTAADPSVITRAELATALERQPAGTGKAGTGGLSEAIHTHLARYFEQHGQTLPPPGLYARILREMEQPLLTLALDATGGNQAKCADMLGINRNTLRKKLLDLDIEVTRRRKMM